MPNPLRITSTATTVSLALWLSLCGIGNASPPGAELRIQAQDADASDLFGQAVDVDGNVAVVGAPGDDEAGTNAGAAYVFRRIGVAWTQQQKLTAAADANTFDGFGSDVAVDRNLIVVGSPGDDEAAGGGSDSGAVYLFKYDGASWVETEKFLPNDVSNAAYLFGTAVDIAHWVPDDGIASELTYVAAGAPKADSAQGVVFLFRLNGSIWLPSGRLVDSDVGGGNDAGELGSSVALNNDNLVAGAPLDDQSGNNTGAAYIFGRTNLTNNWTESDSLYPSTPTPGDMFGASVDLSANLNVAVVGAPAPTNNGVAGRVFIYDGPGPPTIVSGGVADDAYGSAVAIDDVMNLIAVGAKQDDAGGTHAGAIYLRARDDAVSPWNDAGKVVASDAGQDKEFGEAVSLDYLSLIVGGGEEDAFTAGAAYIYTQPVIFSDGFESGSTSMWSNTVP